MASGPGELTRVMRVRHPNLAASALVFFLLRLIAEARPNALFLHANTLRLTPGAPPIIMAGISGAGKSTLTRLLLESTPQSQLVAEDQTILLPEDRLIFPHARAAAERAELAPTDVPWQAFGNDAPRRLRAAPRFAHEASPVPGARVIFLGKRADDGPLAQGTSISSVTWWTPELKQAIVGGGLPLAHVEEHANSWHLHWSRPLTPSEQRLEFALLTEGESLLLKSAGAHASAHTVDRPQAPILEQIPASQGVLEFATHLRPPIPPAEGTTGGRVLMRLARAFADARFFRLEPGGTPTKTVDALLQLMVP